MKYSLIVTAEVSMLYKEGQCHYFYFTVIEMETQTWVQPGFCKTQPYHISYLSQSTARENKTFAGINAFLLVPKYLYRGRRKFRETL